MSEILLAELHDRSTAFLGQVLLGEWRDEDHLRDFIHKVLERQLAGRSPTDQATLLGAYLSALQLYGDTVRREADGRRPMTRRFWRRVQLFRQVVEALIATEEVRTLIDGDLRETRHWLSQDDPGSGT